MYAIRSYYVVVLQESYRFAAGSAIGGLSRAVNRADADSAIAMLEKADGKSVLYQQLHVNKSLIKTLAEQIVSGYQPYLQTRNNFV